VIAFAEVAVGTGESVSCRLCAQEAPATYFSAEEVVTRIRHIASAWPDVPGPNVSLVGAEPLSHPELPTIVSAAVESRVTRVRLRTGAGALGAHGNADGALLAGVRHLEAVVLGAGSAHDRLAGRPGSFADAMAGVRAFRAAADARGTQVAVTALVPVCRHNLESLAETIAALGRAGASSVELAVAESGARAVGSAAWLSAAADTGMVNGVWVHIRGAAPQGMSQLHAIAPANCIEVEP